MLKAYLLGYGCVQGLLASLRSVGIATKRGNIFCGTFTWPHWRWPRGVDHQGRALRLRL